MRDEIMFCFLGVLNKPFLNSISKMSDAPPCEILFDEVFAHASETYKDHCCLKFRNKGIYNFAFEMKGQYLLSGIDPKDTLSLVLIESDRVTFHYTCFDGGIQAIFNNLDEFKAIMNALAPQDGFALRRPEAFEKARSCISSKVYFYPSGEPALSFKHEWTSRGYF